MLKDKHRVIEGLLGLQMICCMLEEITVSFVPSLRVIYFLPELIGALYILLMAHGFFRRGARLTLRGGSEGVLPALYAAWAVAAVAWGSFAPAEIVSRLRYIIFGAAAFYAARSYLTDRGGIRIINLMTAAQGVNLVLTVYQNFIMKLHPDFCNGIFGFVEYNNAAQGCFCVALSVLGLCCFISGTWGPARSFALIGMSCVICAVAEIKIYFVVFAVCAVAAVLLKRHSPAEKRRIALGAAVLAVLFVIAYNIIAVVLPNNLYTFFSLEGYLRYEGRTDYAGRLNTIPFVFENLFGSDPVRALFGVGTGSAADGYIYELGKTFSELGFVGVALLLAVPVGVLVSYLRSRAGGRTPEKLFTAVYAIAFIIAIVAWNCTFTRFAYLNFFFLGLCNVRLGADSGKRLRGRESV
ncbi:MAG: hypothetical protein E7554_09680 [Ruminococcaceae bacterium]|nr:hypothetical protein [Oscillospiraceae bacterium]